MEGNAAEPLEVRLWDVDLNVRLALVTIGSAMERHLVKRKEGKNIRKRLRRLLFQTHKDGWLDPAVQRQFAKARERVFFGKSESDIEEAFWKSGSSESATLYEEINKLEGRELFLTPLSDDPSDASKQLEYLDEVERLLKDLPDDPSEITKDSLKEIGFSVDRARYVIDITSFMFYLLDTESKDVIRTRLESLLEAKRRPEVNLRIQNLAKGYRKPQEGKDTPVDRVEVGERPERASKKARKKGSSSPKKAAGKAKK